MVVAYLLFGVVERRGLKVYDPAVLGNVDGKALSTKRFNFAVDSLDQALTDLIHLTIEECFFITAGLHDVSVQSVSRRRWLAAGLTGHGQPTQADFLNYHTKPSGLPKMCRARRSCVGHASNDAQYLQPGCHERRAGP